MRTLIGHIKGPKGDIGLTGATGPAGPGATVKVGTVSTTAYGNMAEVTNSGTATDAVLDFVIPQGKPGEQTTRMGALTLDTITAQSADFPIPAVGETGSTVFGKIIKFFNSTISALNSKLNISDVVNNLTSTSTTQPLSAAQGKALNDAITDRLSNVTVRSIANGVGGISWSANFKFAIVVLHFGKNTSMRFQFFITPDMLETTEKYMLNGSYKDSTDAHHVRISYTTTYVKLVEWYWRNASVTEPCPMYVYEFF